MKTWRWPALAAVLIAAAAGLHIAYLSFHCPLDLAPDEAHYWDWSRHPHWSYYSKGPLVALLIRASWKLAGARPLCSPGSETLAVRLPAVLCSSLLLWALYLLTVQIYGRQRLAAAVVAMALTLPVVAAGASLMTIDAPYTCCWGWAVVLGHQAVCRARRWAWPTAGVVVGLGILAKYTMVLWLPSAALFLLTTPSRRRLLVQPGFWIMVVIALCCCLPIVMWNGCHDWIGLRHVLGQAGFINSDSGIRWLGPLRYVAEQCGLFLGFWFVAWLAALLAHRPWHEKDQGKRYLWWMSAPTFLVFLLFSLKTATELNWPVAAYFSGLVLAVDWLSRQVQLGRPWYRRATLISLATACTLGLLLIFFMHFSHLARPLLAHLSGRPEQEHPLPLRRIDPTCRLRGWRCLAAAVDRLRAELRRQGIEAIITTSGWTLPGELAFYCNDHPAVFSLGLALGDRHSQYDLWCPNPVMDSDQFLGQTMIVVGHFGPDLQNLFKHLELPLTVTYFEQGQPMARWQIAVGCGFRGVQQGQSEASKDTY